MLAPTQGIISLAASASEIDLDELGEVGLTAPTAEPEAAVALGQELLDDKPGRLIAFSTFEPSAHTKADGCLFFSYAPAPASLAATVGQLRSARGEGIVVGAFCFDVTHLDEMKAVLSAISKDAGRVVYVEAGDCEEVARVYLEREWSQGRAQGDIGQKVGKDFRFLSPCSLGVERNRTLNVDQGGKQAGHQEFRVPTH